MSELGEGTGDGVAVELVAGFGERMHAIGGEEKFARLRGALGVVGRLAALEDEFAVLFESGDFKAEVDRRNAVVRGHVLQSAAAELRASSRRCPATSDSMPKLWL